jgi:hypothetical protein
VNAGRAFLARLPDGLRATKIEQVRVTPDAISAGRSTASMASIQAA